MKPFTTHVGIAAPLIVDDIDTDQIIPSHEMTRVSKNGLGTGLFAGWRYLYAGGDKIGPRSDFVLNESAYAGASILLAGHNFGCGSSREHAVWALLDFGVRVVIAESFGQIFRANCARNGLLAVELAAVDVDALRKLIAADPQTRMLEVDLRQCCVRAPDGREFSFEIDAADRKMLLDGLDHIDYSLQYRADIERFIENDRKVRPWAYL